MTAARKDRSACLGRHLLTTFLVLLLTACDPPSEPVSRQDVEGSWVADGPASKRGTLSFRSDATFVGDDLPDRVFYSSFHDKYGGPPDWTTTDRIKGTWTTEWDGGLQQAVVVINIEGRGDRGRLVVKGRGSEKHLSYYYTDPDAADFLDFRRG